MRITVFFVIDRLRYGLDAVPLPPGTIVVIDRGYLDVATLYARPRNSSAHHPRQGTACGTPGLPRARSTKQKHWLEKRSDDRAAHPELPQCVSGCAACPTATPKRICYPVLLPIASICPRSRSPKSIANAGRSNCSLSGNIRTAIRS